MASADYEAGMDFDAHEHRAQPGDWGFRFIASSRAIYVYLVRRGGLIVLSQIAALSVS